MRKGHKNLLAMMQISDSRARKMLEDIRWPNGAVCPHCGSTEVTELSGNSTRPGVYKCKGCRKQFTVTVGTIFERSHIPLSKWVIAFYMMVTARKGVSALQLQRDLGLASYETAWHMAHRLRLMMKTEKFQHKLQGIVEVDETYVGGKPRPFYKAPKSKVGRGTKKTPVMVMIERGGGARAEVIENSSRFSLQRNILKNVDRSAVLNTDEWKGYCGIGQYFFGHNVICHGKRHYVDGDTYTNTAESFFAIVKRTHYGIFHYISKKHLQRYCDEITFKWNHRNQENGDTVMAGLAMAEGKRLMYKDLVGN